MELSDVMLWVIGLIAIVLVWAVKLHRAKSGKVVPTAVLQWLVYGFAVVLALLFAVPAMPVLSLVGLDPVQVVAAIVTWIGAVMESLAPVFAMATLVYSTLLKKVLDGLADKILK